MTKISLIASTAPQLSPPKTPSPQRPASSALFTAAATMMMMTPPYKLAREPGPNSESPKAARRFVSVGGKFKVVNEREERIFLHRRKQLQQKQKQERDKMSQVSSNAAEPHPKPPPSPHPPRGVMRVTWDERVTVVTVLRSKEDRMAQRAYMLALHHAKEFRKQMAPDEVVDAFFEMEERAVEIFVTTAEPSQVRSRLKRLVRRRLSAHKVTRNERFLKALLALGRDILRLTEHLKRIDPESPRSFESITSSTPPKTPPPPPPAPAPPQCFNIISPTRVRVFLPSWFANEGADHPFACDVDVVGNPNDYEEGERNCSDLKAMVLAIVDSP